ncbi:MAG TPA: hypothetical protein VGF86_06600 [Candidatus Tumulicola sp.]|jgi:hypothetical protein
MSEDTIVPIMFFLIVIGAPIAAWIVSRVLAHQERMEMLRRGFTPPPDPRAMRHAAKYGMKTNWAPGTVPPPGWVPPGAYDPAYYAHAQLRRGIQVACIGFALLIGLSFIGFHDGRYVYGPWLLGGLIPMFVGIAQIITAVLSGASLGAVGAGTGARFGPTGRADVPPGGAEPSGPMPPPPGPYGGWRPGPTPEIEKPAGPPDRA